MLPRHLAKGLRLFRGVYAIQANLSLNLRLVKNRNRVPISHANDPTLKRLRVQGEARREKRDYEGEFHGRVLYQILGEIRSAKKSKIPSTHGDSVQCGLA